MLSAGKLFIRFEGPAHPLDLALVEEPNSRQKTVSVKLLDLPRIDFQRLPFGNRRWLWEEIAYRRVKLR